jgi:hypothetical protein
MNTNSTDQNQRLNPTVEANSLGKRPYVKPAVRHERVFETMALSCGKVQTTQTSCRINRKNS